MSLAGFAYGSVVQPVGPASVSVAGNRVDCQCAAVDEWYVNGPGGLEQGFTVAQASKAAAGDSPGSEITLELALGGDLRAVVNAAGTGLSLSRPDGTAALGYTGLAACDASGASCRLGSRSATTAAIRRSGSMSATPAQGPITIDPFVQQTTLSASDGVPSDRFGSSVAISGDTLVVGAPSGVCNLTAGNNHGGAYVFVEPATGWSNTATMTETAKLTASDGVAGDCFGASVAISGDTIVVGAPNAPASNGAGGPSGPGRVRPTSS